MNDQFQLLIANILCDEVVPLRTMSDSETKHSLLTNSVDFLVANFEWHMYPSCKHRLSWRILTTICSTVVPSIENLERAKYYDTYLGKVFLQYCSLRKLPDDQCRVSLFLDEINRLSPEDICKYVIVYSLL